MPWQEGMDLIRYAMEQTTRRDCWEMWLTRYPYMTKDNFVPFSQYYNEQLRPKKISTRPAEDILRDAEITKRLIEGR